MMFPFLPGFRILAVDRLLGRPLLFFLEKKSGSVPSQPYTAGHHHGELLAGGTGNEK